ncbi:CBS domain-containing protein [Enemella sp. A6]|uniref:CBS domain-containing protein n=1 Tax=Enemella sp. A6 TaxID=3440152 RepID=UPI003EBBCF39
MKISDVIGQRVGKVVTIPSSATVAELLELLDTHTIGCVVVSDDGKQVSGLVSERDVVGQLARGSWSSQSPGECRVGDIMTSTVHTCGMTDDVEELARYMTDHRVRHVPVIEDGQMVGIVSIGDIVKSRLDQLENERDHLVKYVHGDRA